VIVAIALLAASLLSLSGLLVQARRQVAAGREHSLALARARDVAEHVGARSVRETVEALGCDAGEPTCRATSGDGEAPAFLAVAEPSLPGASAELLLEALGAPSLREAAAVRMTVRIDWWTGLRARHVSLLVLRS
jgi:hypothetical protein